MPSPVITRKLKRLAYEKFRRELSRNRFTEEATVEVKEIESVVTDTITVKQNVAVEVETTAVDSTVVKPKKRKSKPVKSEN